MKQTWFSSSLDVAFLKQEYFNNSSKVISISKGDTLLKAGAKNYKLFLILRGELKGFFCEGDKLFEAFHSTKDMFIGVYSFFSDEYESYTTVIAETDCELAYIDYTDIRKPDFSEHFLPVMVQELKIRQEVAQRMSRERELAMQRLFSREKLSTLGQLAAGLAHELNNAIGMIDRKSKTLSVWLSEYLRKIEPLHKNFLQGLDNGFEYSTREERNARKILQKQGVEENKAEALVKLGDFTGTMKHLDLSELEERVLLLRAGISLNNIQVASKHASHVVTSIKELGTSQRKEILETDINTTIRQAILLLKEKTGSVEIKTYFEDHLSLLAFPGDLTQIWINIIQNALESLIEAQVSDPIIEINTSKVEGNIVVNIKDNGPGIPEHIKEDIFKPNFTTKVSGLTFGLGLGLSVVDKIIQAYGGSISVSSKPSETIFLVQIPQKNG